MQRHSSRESAAVANASTASTGGGGIGGAVEGTAAAARGGGRSGLEMWVANLGDCAAVLCREGRALAVSDSHKPDRSDEKQRILDAGQRGATQFHETALLFAKLEIHRH